MRGKIDFDIGTLIYIIITVVAIVAGAFGKKKKPVNKPLAEEEETGSKGFFGKLEEQFGGFIEEAKESVQGITSEFVPVENEVVEEPVIQEAAKGYESLLDKYVNGIPMEDSPFQEYEESFDEDEEDNEDLTSPQAKRSTEDGQILQVINTDPNTYVDYDQMIEDFDLGTAVIYSSIINRQEY